MGHRPVTDLVVQAWLASLPGLDSGMVGATLPQDTTGWAETGFVQATTAAGGGPDPYTGLRRAWTQLDCWACRPGSGKPPWYRANQLAETILAACLTGAGQQDTVDLGPHYDPARILTARALTEPRRVPGDSGGYARYTFDTEIVWVRTEAA